ncbi:MAG TPA: membrane protein insertion efficiency factor YidD [Burkholderiales bacterium]|jgi:putative component of membrane protein insertase Oxa1/YidC/SpoIIIJ protein YidD
MLLWNFRKPSRPAKPTIALPARPGVALAMRPGVALMGAAITGYQRYLSPYKGFRCAYAVLHRSLGCSEAVRQLILRYGLAAGWPHVRQRFADCKAAMQTLRERRAVALAVLAAGALAQQREPGKEEDFCAHQLRECVVDAAVDSAADFAFQLATEAACNACSF